MTKLTLNTAALSMLGLFTNDEPATEKEESKAPAAQPWEFRDVLEPLDRKGLPSALKGLLPHQLAELLIEWVLSFSPQPKPPPAAPLSGGGGWQSTKPVSWAPTKQNTSAKQTSAKPTYAKPTTPWVITKNAWYSTSGNKVADA